MKTEPMKEDKKKKPRTDRTSEKKRERNPEQTEPVKERRRRNKKIKKKELNSQPREEREKRRSQKWSKVTAGYCLWVPYMCLITILPLSYELWKQSYDFLNNFFAMGPTIFQL